MKDGLYKRWLLNIEYGMSAFKNRLISEKRQILSDFALLF